MSLSHGHFLCVQTGQSLRARDHFTASPLASGIGQSSARNEPGGVVAESKAMGEVLLTARFDLAFCQSQDSLIKFPIPTSSSSHFV